MLDCTIISVGSIKENYWHAAIDEYLKRLHPYSKVNFIEIGEERFEMITDRKRVLEVEGKRITKVIPINSFTIALDRVGVSFTSNEWSSKLLEWSRFGKKLTFIIGGPLGLDSAILKKAHVLVSLSKMTFTHQMTRVILLEQVYRGCLISSGKTYHY